MMATLRFGSAAGEFQKGPFIDWSKDTTLRRRPEQNGANVGVGGYRPQPFPRMLLLFGATAPAVIVEYLKWEAEKGNVKTLYDVDAGRIEIPGVTLLNVRPVIAVKRIMHASNGANYWQWINLVFARVRQTTP